jgi:hypothetical protein
MLGAKTLISDIQKVGLLILKQPHIPIHFRLLEDKQPYHQASQRIN